MSDNKWRGLHGPITVAAAETEPERDRLFSQPPRRISLELARLFAAVDRRRSERRAA